VFRDEEVGDAPREVAVDERSDVKFLAGLDGDERAVATALVFKRLDHRFVVALDVELTVRDATPNRPKQRDPVEEEGLTSRVGGVVDEDERSHFATCTVWSKRRVAADLELECLRYRIHHDFAGFR